MHDERRTPYNPFDNAEFRKEFNDTLTLALKPIVVDVADHGVQIKALDKDFNELKNRGKGAAAVLGMLWAGLEFFVHWRRHP